MSYVFKVAVFPRCHSIFLTLVFLCLALSSGYISAATPVANWTNPPYDLSATGQGATLPQIALSSDGTKATAIWARSNGSNFIIQTSSATISGGTASWGAAADLSAIGQNATSPQISLSSDGTKATAVWTQNNGGNEIIQTASATISGGTASWGAAVDLLASGQSALYPQVALSSDGTRATAVWHLMNGATALSKRHQPTFPE